MLLKNYLLLSKRVMSQHVRINHIILPYLILAENLPFAKDSNLNIISHHR